MMSGHLEIHGEARIDEPIWSWRKAIISVETTANAKLICMVILDKLSNCRQFARIDLPELAASCNLSVRTLNRHIAAAIEAGLLHVERIRDGQGRVAGTHYFPFFPFSATRYARKKQAEAKKAKAAERTPRKVESRKQTPAFMPSKPEDEAQRQKMRAGFKDLQAILNANMGALCERKRPSSETKALQLE